MDQHQVGKIDGYLEAVSALKDDGTGFTFDRIGHSDDLSSEISKYFSSLGEILVVKKNNKTGIVKENTSTTPESTSVRSMIHLTKRLYSNFS